METKKEWTNWNDFLGVAPEHPSYTQNFINEIKDLALENIRLYPTDWLNQERETLEVYVEEYQGYTGEQPKLTEKQCKEAVEQIFNSKEFKEHIAKYSKNHWA